MAPTKQTCENEGKVGVKRSHRFRPSQATLSGTRRYTTGINKPSYKNRCGKIQNRTLFTKDLALIARIRGASDIGNLNYTSTPGPTANNVVRANVSDESSVTSEDSSAVTTVNVTSQELNNSLNLLIEETYRLLFSTQLLIFIINSPNYDYYSPNCVIHASIYTIEVASTLPTFYQPVSIQQLYILNNTFRRIPEFNTESYSYIANMSVSELHLFKLSILEQTYRLQYSIQEQLKVLSSYLLPNNSAPPVSMSSSSQQRSAAAESVTSASPSVSGSSTTGSSSQSRNDKMQQIDEMLLLTQQLQSVVEYNLNMFRNLS